MSSPATADSVLQDNQIEENDSPAAKRAKFDEAAKPRSSMPYKISAEVLKAITDNFSPNNLIGPTQFGKAYRGMFQEPGKEAPRPVTIKTVDIPDFYGLHDSIDHVNDEVKFLTLDSMCIHPNIAKLIAYCDDYLKEGFVYDLNPMDSLHNIMTKDNFGWSQRIKVAYSLARLLKTLHSEENSFYVHNVDTSHIMLDKDYNLFMFDFSLMSGGVLGEMSKAKAFTANSEYYHDKVVGGEWPWGTYCDVFAYGLILIELIAKRITIRNNKEKGKGVEATAVWASELAKAGKFPDVPKSLQTQREFIDAEGEFLAKLGMRCLDSNLKMRPTMEQIVSSLECLSVVKEVKKKDVKNEIC